MDSLGNVSALWRYPVKSMLGERCESLVFETRGVEGDRVYAVTAENGKFGSGKTTRRFQRIDGLFGFGSTYDADVPVVRFPDGGSVRGDDPGIDGALSAALGQPVTLEREGEVSHLDLGPVHLITTAALAWLSSVVPDAVADERRFRPNLVVETPGRTQVETEWRGKTICLGETVRLNVSSATERCPMVTAAQGDISADPGILRALSLNSGLNFGVYAHVVVPGIVALGDGVTFAR